MVRTMQSESLSVLMGWVSFALCEVALGRVMPGRPDLAGALCELLLLLLAAAVHLRVRRFAPRLANAFAPGVLVLMGAGVTSIWQGQLAWRGYPIGIGDLLLGGAVMLWLGEQARVRRPSLQPYLAVLSAPLFVVARYQLLRWLEGGGSIGDLPPLLRAAPLSVAALGAVLVALRFRRRLAPVVGVGATLFLVIDPESRAPVSDRPSIVLITVDTLRADDAKEMVVYKQLAALGSEFVDATATAGWTLPSVASIHSGVSPRRHGAFRPSARWPDVNGIDGSRPLLAESFQRAGYQTAALVSNPYLVRENGFGRGFDFWMHSPEDRAASFAGLEVFGRRANLGPRWETPDSTAHIIDEAIHWVTHRPAGPFLLWVHVLGPHLPYPDVHLTPDSPLFSVLGASPGRAGTPYSLRNGRIWSTPEIRSGTRRLYQDEVRYTDRQLQRLLETLNTTGVLETSVVALTSDHGEEFWEHGGFEHGHSLYDELVHVPIVLVAPGGPKGAVRTDPVSTVDLYPTLAAIAGIGAPGDLEGLNLRAPVPADRVRHMLNDLYWARLEGVVAGPWKLVRNDGTRQLHLYHRPSGELEDLAGSQRELVEQLSRALTGKTIDSERSARIDTEALRSLGYVE